MTINTVALTEKSGALFGLHNKIDGCKKCSLYKGNTHYVPGMGTDKAEIMIVGEAPGATEDKLGLPFIGRSGKYLDTLLSLVGLSRERIYITNIVKCRPPENRDPKEVEIKSCKNFLDSQIQIIQPKIIVTLGRFSLAKFLPDAKIAEVHGIPQNGKVNEPIIFPCYHPAVALYNPGKRGTLETDFRTLATLLKTLI